MRARLKILLADIFVQILPQLNRLSVRKETALQTIAMVSCRRDSRSFLIRELPDADSARRTPGATFDSFEPIVGAQRFRTSPRPPTHSRSETTARRRRRNSRSARSKEPGHRLPLSERRIVPQVHQRGIPRAPRPSCLLRRHVA